MINQETHKLSILDRLWIYLKKQTFETEPAAIIFSIISGIGFLAYYFVWTNIAEQAYESMPLRLISIILCIGVLAKNYWPSKLKSFFPIYWYFTLIYLLPFFFTFMLLKNQNSAVWPMNSMTALCLLVLLTEWKSTIAILIIGVSIAALTYYWTTSNAQLPAGLNGWLFSYIPILLVGTYINATKRSIHEEKLRTIAAAGATLAHELATPLSSLEQSAKHINKTLPHLFESYDLAKNFGLPVYDFNTSYLSLLKEVPLLMVQEIIAARTFMRMLEINVDINSKSEKIEKFSIIECIDGAIGRYPFMERQRELIRLNMLKDFNIKGNKLFLTHVFFNLIKNALFYIDKSNKGEIAFIQIWLETGKMTNKVFFKDTGTGISKENLPYIFEQFFSKTIHGTGIGLTFCKNVMQSLGGNIECKSVAGEYTLFILTFPNN